MQRDTVHDTDIVEVVGGKDDCTREMVNGECGEGGGGVGVIAERAEALQSQIGV
jgi:hypothetical protein